MDFRNNFKQDSCLKVSLYIVLLKRLPTKLRGLVFSKSLFLFLLFCSCFIFSKCMTSKCELWIQNRFEHFIPCFVGLFSNTNTAIFIVFHSKIFGEVKQNWNKKLLKSISLMRKSWEEKSYWAGKFNELNVCLYCFIPLNFKNIFCM